MVDNRSGKVAIVFPGQGSQSCGMMNAWEAEVVVRETFNEASAILGYDLWKLQSEGPEATLNRTEVTQPLLLTTSIALWRWAQTHRPLNPVVMAGHSLGEFSALMATGCLPFETGLKMVALRGKLMQAAVAEGIGAMAAILGMDWESVKALCESVTASNAVVEAANNNCPGQVVIAGHRQAVLAAMDLAKLKGAKRTVVLPMSVPSHCSLMSGAAHAFEKCVNDAEVVFQKPTWPVIQNAHTAVETNLEAMRRALVLQLTRPVNWSATIQKMADLGVNTFIECGPGTVLSGLTKRILPGAETLALSLKSEEILCQE